jgi:putative FmdB family regulatory protein
MPIYEYACPKHGKFETQQKYTDLPLTSCKKCGRPLQKLYSVPSIQFKGTGWYVTDYKNK